MTLKTVQRGGGNEAKREK